MVALLRNDPFIDKRQRLMARRTCAIESAIDVPQIGHSLGGETVWKRERRRTKARIARACLPEPAILISHAKHDQSSQHHA
ncbi:hypothetical protein [Paraburkholderia bannensis]|uniref:hypothetical protein n=1 Tax=Paraburkholderia bannensis TaxID=765414 RepID=UPI002ABD81DD|nr:hypothetical protein [Paraburkholderia bannensis]